MHSGKLRTRDGVGAGQDCAGGDPAALPDSVVVALALTNGGFVSITVHTCEGDRQILKQDLHVQKPSG